MGIGIRERIAPGAVLIFSILLSPAPAAPTFQAHIDDAAPHDVYASQSLVLNLHNHSPDQSDAADFLYRDVGDFVPVEAIRNYDVQTGIVVEADQGQEKTFTVSIRGLHWTHPDLSGYVIRKPGNDSREIDPDSGDAAHFDEQTLKIVPSPGSLLVAALGVVLIGWIRLRRAL